MSALLNTLHPFSGQDAARLLEAAADRFGAREALVWQSLEGAIQRWTYRELAADVCRVAAGLAVRGVKEGDRILLHAENCPEFLLTWFACAWVGAVCVVVNPKSAGPELAYFAAHTGAVGAVTQARIAELASSHCRDLRWLVVIPDRDGGTRERPDRASAFDRLDGKPALRCPPNPFAAGSMMFTSGTTARPKAVVWSRGNPLWAARAGALQAGLRPTDISLAFLPLYHVVGLAWTVLPAFWAGSCVVLQPRFSVSRFWPVAQSHRATVAAHVQFSSAMLAGQPVPKRHDFRLWGNSTWLPEYEAYFRVPIVGWWGMTETVAPAIVGDCRLPQTAGSIGRAAPGYELSLVDDRDRLVEPGEAGELRVRASRGISLFSEYFNDEQATRDAFTADGWFRTGDRMRLQPDGSLQFIERSRDVIKTGGEGVSPVEVESVIREVEGVREVSVVARPDPTYGEVGIAFVVPMMPMVPAARAAAEPDAGSPSAGTLSGLPEEILSRCRAQLASFKVPREVRLIDALPRAGLNKIAKGELRRLALSPQAAPDPRNGA